MKSCHFQSVFRKAGLALLVLCLLTATALAGDPSMYASAAVGGRDVSFVTVDMSAGVEAGVLLAEGAVNSAQSVADMAQSGGAFAAVNGTCFSAYDGTPVPWGTIIRDGRLLHTGDGAVAGITRDGRLLVDRLSFAFSGYVNDQVQFYPWRLNHLGAESEAITVFTPEFTGTITPPAGALTVLAGEDGRVISITSDAFSVPGGGFAVSFNEGVSYLVPERFQIGDTVRYESVLETTFTDAADWENVKEALGAGPSLLINGTVTADGEAEGFTEEKINTGRADRSFIGAAADGKIRFGIIRDATLAEAASVCQGLSLVNAICLDGGGSAALYYNGSKTAGRAVNNALGFFLAEESPAPALAARPAMSGGESACGRGQQLLLGDRIVELQAYNIGGSNYFKLRDLGWLLSGTRAEFAVDYDGQSRTIVLTSGWAYLPEGGEGELGPAESVQVHPAKVRLTVNGAELVMDACNIGGSNYFKLRDLGRALNFGVGYDQTQRLVVLDPESGYSE